MDGIWILCINNFYYEMSQNNLLFLGLFEKFITKCDKQRKFHEFQNSDYEVWEKAITKCGKY